MSLHVTPPSNNTAINPDTMTPGHSGVPRDGSVNFDERCISMPRVRDELRVRLGHMGVVICISTATDTGPRAAPTIGSGIAQAPEDAIRFTIKADRKMPCLEPVSLWGTASGGLGNPSTAANDPMVERLSRALEAAEKSNEDFGGVYADAVRLAIVTRLLSLRDHSEEAKSGELEKPHLNRGVRRQACGLPQWRVKRVDDYIEANLDKTITLAVMAGVAGLSAMHFAAQFRATLGIRPHDYLQRRRIERAQAMMLETRDSLFQIALGVGFQTQAHFTTVFHRLVGNTPHKWRRNHRGCH